MRRALLVSMLVAVAAVLACRADFTPASQVSSLRILGVRAVPAEVRPGQSVSLEALVVDPSRPDASTAVLWLGCAPTANTTTSTCSNTDALLALTQDPDAGALPEGVSFLGVGPKVTTTEPTNVFAADAGELERQRGVLASAVLIAAAAPQPTTPAELSALLAKIRSGELPKQVAIFRYPVSESTQPNQDPVLEGYILNGEQVPSGAAVRIPAPDASVDLAVPDASFEPYTEQTPNGPVDRVESLSARYYATPGIIVDKEAVQVRGTVIEYLGPDGGRVQGQVAPDASVPVAATVDHLWTVVRDTRGGQSWIDAPAFVCDSSLPAPSASGASVDGGVLTVTGANLGSVLDLQLGSVVARDPACSADQCTGGISSVDAGSYPLTLRAKTCADVETGISVTIP